MSEGEFVINYSGHIFKTESNRFKMLSRATLLIDPQSNLL